MPTGRDHLEAIAGHLALGGLTGDPVVLKPGSVPVWRIETATGAYHVKIWERHSSWDWLTASLAGVAEIERAAHAAGVAMAEPVALNERVDGLNVTVHRWCEGRPAEPRDDIAAWVGSTLAQLHTIPPPASAPGDSITANYGSHPAEEWQRWMDEAFDQAQPWAAAARDARDSLRGASAIVEAGLAAGERVVGSHRDMSPSNMLVHGDARTMVDWDMAGPELAWFETVRAAVEFGRLAASSRDAKAFAPDPATTRAIIAAYERSGGHRGVGGREAFAGTLGLALNRIGWQMWVSLGHRESTPEERETAAAYVPMALAKLQRRLETLDELAMAIR
jgi:hypothetical protein